MKIFRIVFVGVVAVVSLQVVFAQDYERCNAPIPYSLVEIKPLFGGWTRASYVDFFTERLNSRVRYPARAAYEQIYGIVHVAFIIEKDGSIEEIEVVNNADSLLVREVLRAIREVDRFSSTTPGKQRFGDTIKPVRTLLEAKVHFWLTVDTLTHINHIRTDSVRVIKGMDKMAENVDINLQVHQYIRWRRIRWESTHPTEIRRPTFWQRITRIFR